jgi:signal transduction histidine kinase
VPRTTETPSSNAGGAVPTRLPARRPLRQVSLRGRVAIGVALPVLVALAGFSLMNYMREQRLLEGQVRSIATQLGDVMNGALRQAMLTNDRDLLESMVADIAAMQAIEAVRIVDDQGTIRIDSGGTETGQSLLPSSPGCVECHAQPPQARERTVRLTTPEGMLRIGAPIDNETPCQGCHTSNPTHLGMVLVDVPLQALQAGTVRDLTIDLAASVAVALAVSGGVYLLVHRLIVRRLEDMRAPLTSYAAGDFTVRLPAGEPRDEIGLLAASFNAMAEDLARNARSERRRRNLRQQAAVEERDRIARELHDGLAQILGYVNTKAQAVRLLLAGGQPEAAQGQLQQLEEAAREVLSDVRQAILGLRLSARPDLDLAAKLRSFVDQFRRQSGLAIHLDLPTQPGQLRLAPATEIELLRIVQEALANIRKHADARSAWLRLESAETGLVLTIADDGSGFDPLQATGDDHFGLLSMRERAAAIGAELELDSGPGRGTRVTVHLAAPEE